MAAAELFSLHVGESTDPVGFAKDAEGARRQRALIAAILERDVRISPDPDAGKEEESPEPAEAAAPVDDTNAQLRRFLNKQKEEGGEEPAPEKKQEPAVTPASALSVRDDDDDDDEETGKPDSDDDDSDSD